MLLYTSSTFILYLTIEPSHALALTYLNDISLCHALTVPAGAIWLNPSRLSLTGIFLNFFLSMHLQFETCLSAKVLIIFDLTIKPFLAFALNHLMDSSLCHVLTVPAGTIWVNFFFKTFMLSGKHWYNIKHRLMSNMYWKSGTIDSKKNFKSIHLIKQMKTLRLLDSSHMIDLNWTLHKCKLVL